MRVTNIKKSSKKLGLGADVNSPAALSALMSDTINDPVTTIPVIEHVTFDYAGVLTQSEATTAFADKIDMFSQFQPSNADAVETTFVGGSGLLQTAIIVTHVGFHVFAEPMCFTSQGNELSPAPTVGQASPMSPDVFSNNATAAELGLSGGQSLIPSTLSWGWPMQLAAWHLIEAYMFEWKVRQRYDLLNESARYIAHFGSFSDKPGAGTSQLPVMPFAQNVNARYRSKGGTGIHLPITHARQGLFLGAGGAEVEGDVFRPTNDFLTVDAAWGGLALQDTYRNLPYRRLAKPYYIPGAFPLGLQLSVQDPIHQAALIQLMSVGTGVNPAADTPDAFIAAGATLGTDPEVSLDTTPAIFTSTKLAQVANFKGGNLSMSTLIKGFEMDDDLAKRIMSDDNLRCGLITQCGINFCG